MITSRTKKYTDGVDWDMHRYFVTLEKKWRQSGPRYTYRKLLEVFPQAKAIIPTLLSAWKTKRDEALHIVKRKIIIVKKKSSPENRWFWREVIKWLDIPVITDAERHIARLKLLEQIAENKALPKGVISQEQVQQAKAVSMESLCPSKLRRSGRTLAGLCPLHNERTPSFCIYPDSNSWWCYGCNRGGDTINFIMALHNYSFKQAVHLLIKL